MPINKTTHIEKAAEALKNRLPDSPLLETMRKRYQQIKKGVPPTPSEAIPKGSAHAWQKYGTPHDYLAYLKETGKKDSPDTWKEFQRHIGISFDN